MSHKGAEHHELAGNTTNRRPSTIAKLPNTTKPAITRKQPITPT